MSSGNAIIEEDRFAGYDLIGDVHGCGRTLVALLEKLNYQKVAGVYQYANLTHPRQVVFVGDIVDRGPRIREALHIVRDMVDRGSARLIMGNHEYNALGYCTKARPNSPQTFLREHNERHNLLIKETLSQFSGYSSEWQSFLDWFITLPVFLEYKHFRVVHACWDSARIERFIAERAVNTIDWDFLHASVGKPSFAGQFMDRLTRGIDIALPQGEVIAGRDGFNRRLFRAKFWEESPEYYSDIAFQPDPLPESIANIPITEKELSTLPLYEIDQKPLFMGHYWLSGTPQPLKPNLACLDYSAVKYGRLVAYRLDDEKTLSDQKFVWVDVSRDLPIA